MEQGQQRAAAADVGDEGLALRGAGRLAQRLADRRNRQATLFRRADDLDLQARSKMDAIEKNVGIAGLAGGTGGHRANFLDLVQLQDFMEVAEDGQGHTHAGRPQASTAKGVLPQAGCPLQPLDDLDAAVGQDVGDDHPHAIGADINGRYGSGRLWLQLFSPGGPRVLFYRGISRKL